MLCDSSSRALLAATLVGALVVTTSCGSDDDATVPEALARRGVDVSALFAPPSPDEIANVRGQWQRTDLAPRDVREEGEFLLPNGDTLRVLSHLVGSQRHYGLVITPAGEHAPASLPVAVNLIGFGREMRVEVTPEASAYAGTYLTILPSFRGHRIDFDNLRWVSDGDPYDQCNGGSDDALAFVEAALSTTPAADPSTLVVLGGSRGGNVAMLVGARRTDVDAVVSLAGPTDYLNEDLLDHPNLEALYAKYFVRGLLEGDGDAAEARARMIACSPLYFAESLPPTQIHHGTADLNVPAEQAESLAARMRELDRQSPDFEYFRYEGADHELDGELSDVSDRIDEFLSEVLPVQPVTGP